MSKPGTTPTSQKPVIRLQKSAAGPVFEQIKDAIRHQVSTGAWTPGYRLPTLRQLSTQLGVAYATVERAIRDLTREGILEGRKRGGTLVALPRRKQVGAIGILGYTDYGHLLTQSRYYSTALLFLQEKIIDRGLMAVYDCLANDKPFDAAFNNLTHVDAIVAFDPQGRWINHLRACNTRGIPALCLGETLADDIPSVASASLTDTQSAIAHTLAMGHKHIACVLHTTSGSPAAAMRIEGFKRAMADSPQGFDPATVITGDIPAQAQALLDLRPAPTAIFTPQSRHFPELFQALKGTRLEPGKHTYICAYDENLYCTIQPCGIDFLSVEQRMDSITSRTVDTLLQMREDPAFKPGLVQVPAHIFKVDSKNNKTRLST